MKVFRRRQVDHTGLIPSQLGALLAKGHTLETALATLSEAVAGDAREVVSRLHEACLSRRSLSGEMLRVPTVFHPDFSRLVAATEHEGAKLPAVLQRYPHYQKLLSKILSVSRLRLANRFSYLAMVLVVFLIVLFVYSIFVLPQMASVYESVGAPLPAVTDNVLHLTEGLGTVVVLFVLLVVIAMIVVLVSLKRWLAGIAPWQLHVRFVPFLGSFIRDIARLRALCYLDVLTDAGVPFDKSAETIAQLVHATSVAPNHDAAAQLGAAGILDERALALVAVSVKAGTLDTELKNHIGLEFDRLSDRAATVGNPAMFFLLIAVALVIGMAVYAMYLPIFQLGSLV